MADHKAHMMPDGKMMADKAMPKGKPYTKSERRKAKAAKKKK